MCRSALKRSKEANTFFFLHSCLCYYFFFFSSVSYVIWFVIRDSQILIWHTQHPLENRWIINEIIISFATSIYTNLVRHFILVDVLFTTIRHPNFYHNVWWLYQLHIFLNSFWSSLRFYIFRGMMMMSISKFKSAVIVNTNGGYIRMFTEWWYEKNLKRKIQPQNKYAESANAYSMQIRLWCCIESNVQI